MNNRDQAKGAEVKSLKVRVAELETSLLAARADVRALDALVRLERRVSSVTDREALLQVVLDDLLETFDCDRAWLLYPCDPAADAWSVPMERTREGWPGVFSFGVTIPMDPFAAAVFEEALRTDQALPFDRTTTRSVPAEVGAAFGVRSQLAFGIRPQEDQAWLLGLHHCREDHVYSSAEIELFRTLGVRIGRALDGLVLSRKLAEREEQLARVQRMEAVGGLAGGIAHDFNNQLLVMMCNAELIQLKTDSADQAARAAQIRRAGERAAALTQQLLAFSRRSVLDPRVIDLTELVRDHEQIMRSILGHGVALDVTLAPSPMAIRVDPGQLEQVLINLITNAAHALDGDGCVHLSVDATELAAEAQIRLPAGRYARLTVRDDGPGMSEEVRARIFEPFFTTKARGRGTGLGLSTAAGFAAQSGGSLTVQSSPGAGACFTLLLPASTEAPAPADELWSPTAGTGGSEAVLVVDDDREVAEVAATLLRGGGYRAVVAHGSAAAVACLEETGAEFDLMIADVVMAGLDGLELAERAQALHPGLRVVFATGYSTRSIERMRRAGVGVRILQKPYSSDQLLSQVRATLDAVG